MSCVTFLKDPLDKRRLRVDFTEWLGTSDIASVSWVVPTGITASGDSFSTKIATNHIQGGADGQEYDVSCSITTNDSPTRVKTQRVKIQVEDCY